VRSLGYFIGVAGEKTKHLILVRDHFLLNKEMDVHDVDFSSILIGMIHEMRSPEKLNLAKLLQKTLLQSRIRKQRGRTRLKKFIKKALTRKIKLTRRTVEVEPSLRLVYGVYFAIAALASLTILEALYILILRSFSSEIFAAISLVIGTILGAFFGQKG